MVEFLFHAFACMDPTVPTPFVKNSVLIPDIEFSSFAKDGMVLAVAVALISVVFSLLHWSAYQLFFYYQVVLTITVL